MLCNPFDSKTSRVSSILGESELYSSVLHSRSFIELQIRKPYHLMGQSTVSHASKYIHIEQNLNNSYDLSQSMVSSHHEKIGFRQNPFISAKPYRYKPIAYPNQKSYGLSLWQKNKYLSMYGKKTEDWDKEEYLLTHVKKEENPLGMSKADRVEQILNQAKIETPRRKEQPKQREKPVLNQKDSFNYNELEKPISETSLINNLANIPETKPIQEKQVIHMEDSKVFQYKLGTNLRLKDGDDQQYNFDTGKLIQLADANRELDETSKFNSLRPPTSIHLGDTVYELITFC